MAIRTMLQRLGCGVSLTLLLAAVGAHAQGGAAPIKQGLWETTITSNMQIELPPELQARIAAMTPQQQAMLKANMGGMGGAPTTTTTRSCAASQQSMDSLLDQAQQKGTKCTFTNRTQTADGASFDTSCTMQQGTATGHSEFHMPDGSHVSGTTHMTMQVSGRGGSNSATIDSTYSSKYLGADCGDVKPNTSVAVPK